MPKIPPQHNAISDPDLKPVTDPHEISNEALKQVQDILNRLNTKDPEYLGDWFGRFITSYRCADQFSISTNTQKITIEQSFAQNCLLRRNPGIRLAWRQTHHGAMLYINGEEHTASPHDAKILAAAETIDHALYTTLSHAGRELLKQLLADMHYEVHSLNDVS